MPPNENGASELVKKILNRKDKIKEAPVKEQEDPPVVQEEAVDPKSVHPAVPLPPHIGNTEKLEEVADMGNMTAADLRKSSIGKFNQGLRKVRMLTFSSSKYS